MRRTLLFLSLIVSLSASSQMSAAFTELRAMPKQDLRKNIGSDSSLFINAYDKGGIKYLLPFYKAIYYEQSLKKDSLDYYMDLSESLAFVGDVKSIGELRKQMQEKLSPTELLEAKKLVDSTKDLAYDDARKYLLSKTRTSRVVMINEAIDNPLHRVFTNSLLEDLYNQGFRYLAMDLLNNRMNRAITKVDMNAGYGVYEPAAGELIRRALELGFTVVPYEDTVRRHNIKQREYAQAENLATIIKKDAAAKIIVQAGYSHVQEAALSDDFIPMAAYFKIISGIDPLTINQTNMSEGGTSAFEGEVYRQFIRKHPITTSTVALLDGKSIDISGMILNDIYVIHPPVKFVNERPNWMAIAGNKEIAVPAAYKSVFLVQGYFLKEYNDKTAATIIPADQTYNSAANGLYYLYLRKGMYKIVFRDKNYAILGSKDIEVK